MTEKEIDHYFDIASKQSCGHEPVPSEIQKGCKRTLVPILTNFINVSLQSACMPAQLKEAMVKPVVKKNSLEPEQYSKFRPMSNLKFVSKITEKAIAC